MVLGTKGAGITTQIQMLCDKYKLSEFKLKDQFLAKMDGEKGIRKRRRLLDRGFVPLPPMEENDDGVQTQPPDPAIEDDPEDFDREVNERTLIRTILESQKGLVIDGTWNGFPEDKVTAVEGGAYGRMLTDSRRAPEIVIVLRANENSAFKRLINDVAIKKEFDRLMKERYEAQ